MFNDSVGELFKGKNRSNCLPDFHIYCYCWFLLLLSSICIAKFPLHYLKGMMTETTGKLKTDILTIRM